MSAMGDCSSEKSCHAATTAPSVIPPAAQSATHAASAATWSAGDTAAGSVVCAVSARRCRRRNARYESVLSAKRRS